MIEELSFLDDLQEAYIDEATWSREVIRIKDQPVERLSVTEFKSLTERVNSRPRWFREFQLTIPASSPYKTNTSILSFQTGVHFDRGGIDDLLEESSEDHADWAGRISDYFSQGNTQEAVDRIFDAFKISRVNELHLSVIVNKSNIVEDFCDENSLVREGANPQLWTSKDTLEAWIDESKIEHLIETQFSGNGAPYHLFYDDGGVENSQFLGMVSAHSLENDDLQCLPAYCQEQYAEEHEILKAVFEDTAFEAPSISPLVFNGPVIRDIYQSIFTFAAIACLASTYSIEDDFFEAEIKTDRHHARSEFNFEDPSDDLFDVDQLSQLYQLVKKVLHSDGPSSLTHWHQAVATHCSSFREVPRKIREIRHYCGFLQEEAAKQELEQLQNTVEEAFELTRTIADSLSEASQSLTSDLQKIIITLLVAIVTNFVLILRYSDLHVLAPFSVAAIAAILLFYFPVIQNEIDETQSIMENRTADFIIYLSEIRSHVGTRVFDLGKIEDQHETHLRTAFNSLQNAKRTTSRIYFLMTLIWITIIFYGLIIVADGRFEGLKILFGDLGLQTSANQGEGAIRITILLSAVPAFWLLFKLIHHFYSSDAEFCACPLNPFTATSHPEIQYPRIESESADTDGVNLDLFEDATPRHYFEYCPILLLIFFISIVVIAAAALFFS